ncbi:MAG TPA: DUF5642 family protein [Mycobacterium sp.]|nr:DUF5642 family protein [Mycobacterium sp.]
MRLPSKVVALVGAVLVAGCSTGGSHNASSSASAPAAASSSSSAAPAAPAVDIGKILSVKSTFGADFKVQTIDKTGIDPKLLAPIQFQEGLTWDPAECAKYAWTLPSGLKGNIATVLAEGQGNRFIAMAIETSEPVAYDPAVVDKCRHVTFSGPGTRGVVDVVDAPQIQGAPTLGKHRILQTAVGSGELYTYVAYLGNYLVVVTANPLLTPNQPVPPVNVQRAQQLLSDSVAAVRH